MDISGQIEQLLGMDGGQPYKSQSPAPRVSSSGSLVAHTQHRFVAQDEPQIENTLGIRGWDWIPPKDYPVQVFCNCFDDHASVTYSAGAETLGEYRFYPLGEPMKVTPDYECTGVRLWRARAPKGCWAKTGWYLGMW